MNKLKDFIDLSNFLAHYTELWIAGCVTSLVNITTILLFIFISNGSLLIVIGIWWAIMNTIWLKELKVMFLFLYADIVVSSEGYIGSIYQDPEDKLLPAKLEEIGTYKDVTFIRYVR